MGIWKQPYKIRRSTHILSYAVQQNYQALNLMGEAVFLLQRKQRSNSTFQWQDRKVPTITTTASGYTTDPDTGGIRYLLWQSGRDSDTVYPDIATCVCTVVASGGTTVWEQAVDKYSFILGREEYAFDIYRDQIDALGNPITDAVYVVFNTPPMHLSNTTILTYGSTNPLTNFPAEQPIRDDNTAFYHSLYGFEQWINPDTRIRRKISPHRFLLAFPGVQSDFTLTEGGLLQESRANFWTVPPPYSPRIYEHDVIVRENTGARYQAISITPIYIENILVSQHLDLSELDPKSSIYRVPIIMV